MKTINLAMLLFITTLMASGLAQAKDKNDVNNQNLSKRPYQQLPDESAYSKEEGWEGATLKEKESGPTEYQKLRINMLGKQPYLEGKPD